MGFDEYIEKAAAARAKCRENAGIDEDDDVESMYFVSTLPWLKYSALVQPVGGDSNPRITWGKYEEDAWGRLIMPVSILAHHALTDGIHISRFYDNLTRNTAALDTWRI